MKQIVEITIAIVDTRFLKFFRRFFHLSRFVWKSLALSQVSLESRHMYRKAEVGISDDFLLVKIRCAEGSPSRSEALAGIDMLS